MPDSVLPPAADVEDGPGGARSIAAVPTAIAAFVGWTPAGPTGRAELVQSRADFARIFGGLDSRSYLGYAVSHFFACGGTQAYVIRVAADQDGAVLTPAAASDSPPGAFETAILPGSPGGVDTLAEVDIFNLLCVPGEANPATLHTLAEFCRDHRAMLVADCYEDATFDSLKSGPPEPLAAGESAAYAALYFPWILAADPLQADRPRAFPPCGFVAGIWARTDAERGVWKAPAGAGASLRGASGLAVSVGDPEIAVLNPLAINCIRNMRSIGTVIWGERTLAGGDRSSSEWKFIAVRRLMLLIEESIVRGLAWAVFEPNDDVLWSEIRRVVGDFLHSLFQAGALQGQTPRDAYWVRCGRDTMTQNDIDQGTLVAFVGVALIEPAEFVIFRFGQTLGK